MLRSMKCRKCNSPGPFYFNKTKGVHEHWCVECHRAYRREHYRLNRAAYLDRLRTTGRRKMLLHRARITALKNRPCMDCGNSYPAVCMDFDHVLGKKLISVSLLPSTRYRWERIEAEIAKCDLVCANCHRLRTQKRLAVNPPATNRSKG
jgi:hypothetical protein